MTSFTSLLVTPLVCNAASIYQLPTKTVTCKTVKKLSDFSLKEAVVKRCSVEKVLLKISQTLQENTCAQSLFLNKVAGLRTAALLK